MEGMDGNHSRGPKKGVQGSGMASWQADKPLSMQRALDLVSCSQFQYFQLPNMTALGE